MSFITSQKSRLLIGDFSLSAFLKNIHVVSPVEMLDTTVLTDTAKTFLPSGDTSTLTADGLLDSDGSADAHLDQLSDWKAATAPEAVSYGSGGLALGSDLWMVGALAMKLEVGSTRAGLVTFDTAAQVDGPLDVGHSLHDLTAETADGDGTGYDQTAVSSASGGVGHLHVTAFSGFSGVAVTIADSANNSTWATIGTFTTVAGITSQRLVIAGTVRRYVRASWDVTGSGSITFQVGFARR